MTANSETHNFKRTQNTSRKRLAEQEKKLQERCRKFGVPYEMPAQNKTYLKLKNKKQKLNRQIERK